MLKISLDIEDLLIREALEELLPQAGVEINSKKDECEAHLFSSPQLGSALPSLDFLSLQRPMRFLDFLSLVSNLPYSQEVVFSHFSLDLREKNLKNLKTNIVQRLTEKECQLLRFFYQNKGKSLSKEKLLTEIWEYHPDTETHTLETHIYRLRQKLEEDPNFPQVLLNNKDGYWID